MFQQLVSSWLVGSAMNPQNTGEQIASSGFIPQRIFNSKRAYKIYVSIRSGKNARIGSNTNYI